MSQMDLFDHSVREPLAPHPPERTEAKAVVQVVEPLTVEDAATFERAMSGKRTSNHRDQILALLKQGSVTNFELADICIRYSARIHELRKQGHDIETRIIDGKTGLTTYRIKEAT